MGNSRDLLFNCMDYLALNKDLIKIRSRKPRSRMISAEDVGSAGWWKFFNLMLVPILLIALGTTLTVLRKISRDRYTVQHIND